MSNIDLRVVPIDFNQAKPWILKKHYAKRVPSIQYSFALVKNNQIQGVVTYGVPSTNQVAISIIGYQNNKLVIELNRLCLDTDIKNAASILVSNSLKMLPPGLIVVSYADTRMNHVGYVYQATNFFYCGLNKACNDFEFFEDGRWKHSRGLSDRGFTAHAKWARETGAITRLTMEKHRYVFITGNKKDKRRLRKLIKWTILSDYPKSQEKARYDSGAKLADHEIRFIDYPKIDQGELF